MSYNLKMTVYNNRDYEQPFILKNPDNSVFDLTNCQLIFGYGQDDRTIGTHVSGSSANKCIFITDAVNGAFSLKLPYLVLKALEAGTYSHDLVVLDTSGKREGVWQGQMVVKKGFA